MPIVRSARYLGTEDLGDARQRQAQPRLRRALRDVQHLGDLAVRVPVEVGQLQRPPLRVGKHLEGGADLAGGVRPEHRLGNVGHVALLPCHPRLTTPVRFLPADRIDRTAVGERPEEAAQGAAPRIDALRMLPQGHEHLLGDVLGGLRVDQRPHGEPVDEAGVTVVQVDEGRLVATGQALDQNPLRPPGLMPFVHEASPLHGHRSKPSAGADHNLGAARDPYVASHG